MSGEIRVRFAHGGAAAVYDDALVDTLTALGDVTIERASHVEPVGSGVGWVADMSPVDGPFLTGFATRADALAAERAWLFAHKGI